MLDGSNALSHETAAESSNRDGAQCARLQHEARDGDHRRGRAAAGLGRLSRGAPRVQINANKRPRERLERVKQPICSDRYSTIAEANVPLTMVLIPTPFHTAWAHRDRPAFLGRLSLTGHCGHGWTCSLPHPVPIDPQRNWRSLCGAGKSPRRGRRPTASRTGP